MQLFNRLCLLLELSFSLAIGMASLATQAYANGYVESPKSRAYQCSGDGGSRNIHCGVVGHEPQSIEYIGNPVATDTQHYPSQAEACTGDFTICGPADGSIAAGGVMRFSELNEQSPSRWSKVAIKPGEHTFVWKYVTGQATRYWQYFITKKDWNPNQPLSRDSFESQPLLTQNWDGSKPASDGGTTEHVVDIPHDHTGYHVILATWKVANSDATYYQVIDLAIQPDDAPVSAWKAIGTIEPEALTVGDKVLAQMVTKQGDDLLRNMELSIETNEQGQAKVWPYLLAQKVNAAHLGYLMGVVNDKGEVVPNYGKNDILVSQDSDVSRVKIKKQLANQTGELNITGMQPNYTLRGVKVELSFNTATKGPEYTVEATVFNANGESIAYRQSVAGDNTSRFLIDLQEVKAGKYNLVVVAKSARGVLLQKTHQFSLQEKPSEQNNYTHIFPAGLDSYVAGTTVLQLKDGHAYECKPFPYSKHCAQWTANSTRFEPGVGTEWQSAWSRQ